MPWLLAQAVYAWMVALQPTAPWRDRYADVAEAIAEAAEEAPLFEGEDGAYRTAAVLTSLAFRESSFDPGAVGDHGRSFGLFQVSSAHAPRKELLDPSRGARHAIRLLRVSFRLCEKRPLEEKAAWYAHGSATCPKEGYAASRRRMLGAKWLIQQGELQ